jgi:hypothetical protein
MTTLATYQCPVPFRRPGRKRRAASQDGECQAVSPEQRVPRLARLMALAVHLEELIQTGKVKNYATLGRLGHVSRSRVSQIMNLLLLAPDIQEQILFLQAVNRGRDPIHLSRLQPVAGIPNWSKQRRLWTALVRDRVNQERRLPTERPVRVVP